MMSELEELKNRLAVNIGTSHFLLEQRTATELLDNIRQYTTKIPFASNKDSFWNDFWLGGSSVEQLAAIYQDGQLAEKSLPVQQTFLLALLQLLETPKLLLNSLPARHRSLYYRDLLGFTLKDPVPDNVAVSFTLTRTITEYLLPAATALNGGQDSAGNRLTYLTDDNLLINGQQLSQVSWTRQQDETSTSSDWLLGTALDTATNISLPDDGIRLFGPAEHEQPLQQTVRLDQPLLTLSGDIRLTIDRDNPLIPSLISQTSELPLSNVSMNERQTIYYVSSVARQQARKAYPQGWKTPQLALRAPLTQPLRAPQSLILTLINCEEIRYFTPNGLGQLNSFSYPFGVSPQSGDAFQLRLPVELVKTGGKLTIQPQWRDLPPQGFARWYANYPHPPQNNQSFSVKIFLLSPGGETVWSNIQPLFSGDDMPQCQPLNVTLPADVSATEGYTVRVELNQPDFFYHDWQLAPADKNAPWIPQVSCIDTKFTANFSQNRQGEAFSGFRASSLFGQALYLGFSEVSPGDTLSVYWSINGPAALTLNWFAYNQQEEWEALESGLQDGTSGLSGSGLWRIELPQDAAAGSNIDGLSADCYWVKATPADGQTISADHQPKLKAIVAGAITATLSNEGDINNSHFTEGLPANTISQLVTPISVISSVSQPLPSSGGRARETEQDLMQRAATRIAHRQRAISWGNMRSMLMENYPQLFDIQFPDEEKLNRIPALSVQQLLAIPDSRYRDNDDALRPTLSPARLAAMSQWLTQYSGLWADPVLINPTYVDVTARYRVIFISGVSERYGYAQLSAWLQQQYMPWGEDQQLAVTPGNKVDYYQLLATIQQFPLVQRAVALTLTRTGGSAIQQSIIAGENEVLILIPSPDSK